MSELRIALVVEGKTDYIIIEAALKAILDRPFTLTTLQPEKTKSELGEGWTGVLKWCHASSKRHPACLDDDPTLEGYDLLIIHLDVDVSGESYANAGAQIQSLATQLGWRALPCAQACPPVIDSANALVAVLDSWLQPARRGNKTIVCLPAQASGTWLAAASLPAHHALLVGAECNPSVESRLAGLPLAQRIRKKSREYQDHASKVTANWKSVKAVCSQADMFENAVLAAV